ncbi:MAG: VTT domain-containing protein [bacterium]|nr:VTT domain-containing protein [bacterium]
MSKRTKNLLWVLGSVIITAVFLLPLFSTRYFELIKDFISLHPVSAPVVVIFFRFIGVVLAPLPGSPVGLASIAVLPWWQAWIYNLVGVMTGVVAAFLIARKFRERAVARFASLRDIHGWQDKIPKHRQFWTIVFFRLTSIAAFDFVSYALGLTRMSFKMFLSTSLVAEVPWSFALYYLGGVAASYSIYLFIPGVLTLTGLIIFLKPTDGKNWLSKIIKK